ncbi:MAG TPA: carboxypeptidase-like regulatory domain-containing protein [Gemmatimonadaceae bacterium]|nr:carboxypeptidase-like regulatory domain-containing protein [Gemmatimonadaceae bacterium]
MTRAVLRALLPACIAPSLLAQGVATLRGDIVLPDGRTGAAGMTIEVTDSAGAVVARALTGDRGIFVVRLPHPGRYGLHALRIGFRPTAVPPVDVSGAEPSVIHIVLRNEPVRLTDVTVRGRDVCGMRPDSGELIVQVWEQVRQALSSTQLGLLDTPLEVRVLSYRRVLDATGRKVLSDSTNVESFFTAHAFASPPPDSLERAGYARVDSGNSIYYFGPDADALISDPFAASHCFQLMPPSAEWPGSVGVAFRPARERRGAVDIRGVFWLDRMTAELQALEYRYTNLPREVAEPWAGGRIEFVRLSDGGWLLNRWHIRVATVSVRPETTGTSLHTGRRAVIPIVVERRVNVFGGEVTAATRVGRELYNSAVIALDAVVVPSRGSFLRPDSVEVELVGPGYFAVGDSGGRVHFARLRPGSYTALITTADMRAAGLPAIPRTIAVNEGAHALPVTVTLPTGEELLAAMCGTQAARRGEAFVAGTLTDESGYPLADEWVVVQWGTGALSRADFARMGGEQYAALTDGRGRWVACGISRGASVSAQAKNSIGANAAQFLRLQPEDFFAVMRVTGLRSR